MSLNYRNEFIKKSQSYEKRQVQQSGRLDQDGEERELQKRLDGADPREQFTIKGEFLNRHGYLPGWGQENVSSGRKDNENPRDAFIRRSHELGGSRFDSAPARRPEEPCQDNVQSTRVTRQDSMAPGCQLILDCEETLNDVPIVPGGIRVQRFDSGYLL